MPELLLRPSFLDTVAACPAAAVESAGRVDPGNDLTAKGQAMHAGIQRVWETGAEINAALVESISREFGIELVAEDAIASLRFARGWLEEHMPRAKCEVNVGVGTVDALQLEMDDTMMPIRALGCDWKGREFGREDPDSMLQQLAYVVAVADKYGVTNISWWVVYHSQEAATQRVDFDAAAIERAREEVARVKARAVEQAELVPERRSYRDGDWCSRCRGASTCPALVTVGLRVGSMLSTIANGTQITLDEKTLPTTWAAVKRVLDAADDFKKLVKKVIEARNGESIFDDSGELRLQRDRLPEPKPKYDDLVAALVKRDPKMADELDREVRAALPQGRGFKEPYVKLYGTKKNKKEIQK